MDTPLWGIVRVLPRNFGKMTFKKNGKNIVSLSSLSQHVMCFPNAAGIHGDLYGVWWYESYDMVQNLNPKSSSF